MRRELWLAAQPYATRHSTRPAFTRARAHQLALELCQAAEDSEHQAAVRGRCIGPCVMQRPEAGFPASDRRESVEQVAGRARQPIEPGHHQHVAGFELLEHTTQLRTVGLCTLGHFAEHLAGSDGRQLGNLRLHAMTVR